jgi:hypothetical protein
VEIVQLVRELARMLPDQSPPPTGSNTLGRLADLLRVRNFRSVHQIAIYREGERAERHELTCTRPRAALRQQMTVVRLIRTDCRPRDRLAGALCDPRRYPDQWQHGGARQ